MKMMKLLKFYPNEEDLDELFSDADPLVTLFVSDCFS